MAKFIYRGKKQNFKLDPLYKHDKPLNPGDSFELTGEGLSLMQRAIQLAKHEQGIADKDQPFVLAAQVELEKATESLAEEVKKAEKVEDVKEVKAKAKKGG